jgi:6-pyruvoyl-tetrahydropterin synthase
MSLKISSFYTPECQSFIFRNACFPILVDLVTHRCLKNYAHAPIYSTLAGFFTVAVVSYQSPLPLLGGAIYLAYKATSYVLSRVNTPTETWDDDKVAVALNTILTAIEESKASLEPLYTNPSSRAAALVKDPGNSTLAEILDADIHTLARFVEELLKKMDPPLLSSVKDLFESIASLVDEQKKARLLFAQQKLSNTRREIFQRLNRHLNKVLLLKENPVRAAADLGQIFSRLFIDAPSESFIQVITYLINNPQFLK